MEEKGEPRWRERRRFLLPQPELVALTTPTKAEASQRSSAKGSTWSYRRGTSSSIDWWHLGYRERCFLPYTIAALWLYYIPLSYVYALYNGERYWISNVGVPLFSLSEMPASPCRPFVSIDVTANNRITRTAERPAQIARPCCWLLLQCSTRIFIASMQDAFLGISFDASRASLSFSYYKANRKVYI